MFRVEWIQTALDDLTTIWMGGDSALRQAITTAARAIDEGLEVDPFRQTESRDEDERVFFAYPLGVQIEVDLLRRIVWVLHAWRLSRRSK